MDAYKNILCVIDNHEAYQGALATAARLAKAHEAALTILVVYKTFPKALSDYETNFRKEMRDDIAAGMNDAAPGYPVEIAFESDEPHLVRIVQRVLKNGHDLLIKPSDPPSAKGTLNTLDAGLLRKCPCTLWLQRGAAVDEKPSILVAVDPQAEDPAGYDLNLKLLGTGDMLANQMAGECAAISSWHYEHEEFLRHSPFAGMEDEDIKRLVEEADHAHDSALQTLIGKAGFDDGTHKIIRKKSRAADMMVEQAAETRADIFIMGSVARTGIQGFLIGNTAETVAARLPCTLVTAKPDGFVCPIKAEN